MFKYEKIKIFAYKVYILFFLFFLILPLFLMVSTSFNSSSVISVTHWEGFTFSWFLKLFQNQQMLDSIMNSIMVAILTTILSNILGLSAAIVLQNVHSKIRNIFYAFFISPILTPGIIIGMSTLILWNYVDVAGGILLMTLAKSSFIASYCFLFYITRLQKLEINWVEAASDLGANGLQTMKYIVLPFLFPTFISSTIIAFLQSFENYNTSIMVSGAQKTLPIYIGSFARKGLNPEVTALATVLIFFSCIIAIIAEYNRLKKRKYV